MKRIALAGFGAVGQELARVFRDEGIDGAQLTAVTSRDLDKARAAVKEGNFDLPVVPLSDLPDHADIVVECATAAAFPDIARCVIGGGRILIAVSVAGVLDVPDIEDLARINGGQLHICSGALPGLDIVRAVRERGIKQIKLTSRIRTGSLAKEPYVVEQGIDVSPADGTPVTVFSGTAHDAAKAFPRHFNVAIALSLGGVGFERTMVEIIADANIPGPVHHIDVEAVDSDLTLESRNRASSNPRTAAIVAPSLIAAIRGYCAPIRVGT